MKLSNLNVIKLTLVVLVILINVSCDQITKVKARSEILDHEVINIIGDNFVLTKVENTGAAMSLGQDFPPVLKVIAFQILPITILILAFVYIVRNKKISKLNVLAISCIIGGGIGNIYDRILYQSVTDFMYLSWGGMHTGIFNMADVSVLVGVFILFANIIVSEFAARSQKSIPS